MTSISNNLLIKRAINTQAQDMSVGINVRLAETAKKVGMSLNENYAYALHMQGDTSRGQGDMVGFINWRICEAFLIKCMYIEKAIETMDTDRANESEEWFEQRALEFGAPTEIVNSMANDFGKMLAMTLDFDEAMRVNRISLTKGPMNLTDDDSFPNIIAHLVCEAMEKAPPLGQNELIDYLFTETNKHIEKIPEMMAVAKMIETYRDINRPIDAISYGVANLIAAQNAGMIELDASEILKMATDVLPGIASEMIEALFSLD
jgi:hypothetical protein